MVKPGFIQIRETWYLNHMTGGSRIVAIGSGVEEAPAPVDQAEELLLGSVAETGDSEAWNDEQIARPKRRLIIPALALIAIAGWSGFFIWANDWILGGTTPQQAISLVTSWAVPVLLVVGIWILLTRNSREEALRFGETARSLSQESAQLETRLTVVNRELSLAREFLASQSRDLDSLGRVAAEKLSAHAQKLETLIAGNRERIDSIAMVSSNALENMEKLRGQLPVIASSAKDASNNIANAGRTAHAQLGEMITGLGRLNEFGQISERHVESMKAKIEGALDQFGSRIEQLKEASEARFADLEARGVEFREALDLHEVNALASIRTRSAALLEELDSARISLDENENQSLSLLRARLGTLRDESDVLAQVIRENEATAMDSLASAHKRLEATVRDTLEKLDSLDQQAMKAARERIAALSEEAETFDQRLAERNEQFDAEAEKRLSEANMREREQIERVQAQLAELDALITQRIATHDEGTRKIAGTTEAIDARLVAADERIKTLGQKATATENLLGNKLQAMAGHIAESEQSASAMMATVSHLTDDSVRLLELLQASTQQSREGLPLALAEGSEHLTLIEGRIRELEDSVARAAARAEEMASRVSDTRGTIGQSLEEIGTLHGNLEAGALQHGKRIEDLRSSIESLDKESVRIADFSRDEMSTALEKLSEATRDAASALEESGGRSVDALAKRLASESTRAIDEAIQHRMEEAIDQLNAASERASAASYETARRLRDQLAKISELAENLERRVTQARERAEEQVDNDFSRRVALITESLNSNAIDIAKAMSSEVTDTSWAAYLRGDRGIFTRRAVRLLDSAEARSVAQIYRNDDEFREHVSRYIHDFEAMLRQLLSTRDGHALSVTLLSSDMGKLYVALAQSIERLRD